MFDRGVLEAVEAVVQEKRLKVATEVLGDHAWVKTWIQHTAVVKLLDALIEARMVANLATRELSDLELLNTPRFTGPATTVGDVYDQAVHVASLARNYFVSQSGEDGRNALKGMVEVVGRFRR